MTHPTSTAATSASPPPRGEGLGVGGHPQATTSDLATLEHTLWRSETRYDHTLMEATFAPDFREFGRSGRRYTRDDLLPDGETQAIDATLHDLTVTELSDRLALVTYISELRTPDGAEWANRASVWDRSAGRWQLRFHQATPCGALP